MNEFANLFSSKRIEKGLSQDEIASMLNVTRQAVSKWENGKAMPDIALMPKIAEIFNISLDELITGNEPDKKIVEKIVVQEKEIAKPLPKIEKILAILIPVLAVLVLAIVLMCTYIPIAIEKNTPPLQPQEPEPTVEYTPAYVKGGQSVKEDNISQAELINGRAYYKLMMTLSSNYTIYITAPKGAVAYFNDEKIAEFEVAKTVEYSQYFVAMSFEKDNRYPTRDEYFPKIISEYNFINKRESYKLVLDLTNCSEDDCIRENQYINIKQQIGFDNIVIPAHSSYFVAYEQCEVDSYTEIHHFLIKSEGIKYYTNVEHSGNAGEPYSVLPFARQFIGDTQSASRKDFYIVEFPSNKRTYGYVNFERDLQIGFINISDKDQVLELEEVPIEEIEFGQIISLKTDSIEDYNAIYKINVTRPSMFSCKYIYDELKHVGCNIDYIGNGIKDCDYLQMLMLDLEEGWSGKEIFSIVEPGIYYVSVRSWSEDDVKFVINDKINPIDEFVKL